MSISVWLVAAAVAQSQLTDAVTERYQQACPRERHEVATARMREIAEEDQTDRSAGFDPEIITRDRERRAEVAILFAEGCIQSAQDNFDAGLVFQHGEVPEHYYQAFVFADRAVRLGNEDARWLVPRAIDRYLLAAGYQQLFGSNYLFHDDADGQRHGCLVPVVSEFTDEQRAALGQPPIEEKLALVKERDPKGVGGFCEQERPEPPRGLFPGVW